MQEKDGAGAPSRTRFYNRRKKVSVMTEKRRLPDAELEVMQIVWRAGQPVTSGYVQEHAAQDWKVTSVLTFLSRLCEKGFLTREKCGKQNFYAPLVDENSYLQQESASFLQRVHRGSFKGLVASLAGAGALDEADIAELRAFLDGKGGAGE